MRSLYGLPTSDDLFLTHVFAVDENTMSAYVMADAELTVLGRPLKLEAGVRYTTVSTHFSFTDRYAANPVPTASANHSDPVSYTHLDVYKRQRWS